MSLFQTIKSLQTNKHGALLVLVIVFAAIATLMIISGLGGYSLFENRVSTRMYNRDMALDIAEAGINYYRWHLAHTPTDFQDGTGKPGPYVHIFTNKDGNSIGYFSLIITPPISGSTIITIKSIGWTVAMPNVKRAVQIRLGFPALTDFSFVENRNMIFSKTSIVHGKVHANGGIQFNGTSDAIVESAKKTYSTGGATESGIWGIGGPKQFWKFPVPAKDFNAITADLGKIKTMAENGGVHLTSSGKQGWHLVFKSNGTFDVYKVIETYSSFGYPYDIRKQQYNATYTVPKNGAIFVEDTTWVDGIVHGRVTVGVGQFPVSSPYKNLLIDGNITYSKKASKDVLGLLAQGNIYASKNLPNDMEVDGALLSQFGKIGIPYYWYTRNSLLLFGSQISSQGGGWKWSYTNGTVISGFIHTTYTYDGNLKFNPPPGFPVQGSYELISWEEVSP